jgi:putative NADH-flavin reductase
VKVLVVGATGATGRHVVQAALAAGHQVTAFVRTPRRLGVEHERLRMVQGDVLEAASVRAAMQGQGAVISALGVSPGAPPGGVISKGAEHMIRAMKEEGARRMVFQSGIMVGEGKGLSSSNRLLLAVFRRLNRKLFEDKVRAERLVEESALDWVLVRPPKLRERPPRGSYRAGEDLDVSLLTGLAFADVADFMIRALHDDRYLHRKVELGY